MKTLSVYAMFICASSARAASRLLPHPDSATRSKSAVNVLCMRLIVPPIVSYLSCFDALGSLLTRTAGGVKRLCYEGAEKVYSRRVLAFQSVIIQIAHAT